MTETQIAEIIHKYVDEKLSLRYIALLYDTNHQYISRLLKRHGIETTNEKRIRKPYGDSAIANFKIAARKRKRCEKRAKSTRLTKLKNMKNHMRIKVELSFLEQFDDVEKLSCLNRMLRSDRVPKDFSVSDYKAFIEHFYHDRQFTNIYDEWVYYGKRPYMKPSLDHIVPTSLGGTWELSNLQILPWIVNRAKTNLPLEDWHFVRMRYFNTEVNRYE